MRRQNKIQDAWDSTPYKVVHFPADYDSVYTVEPVNNPGQNKKMHRTNLRKGPTNPNKEENDPRPKPASKPRSSDPSNAVSDGDDSDEELILILPKECIKPTPVPSDEPEPIGQTNAEPVYPVEREPIIQSDRDPLSSADSGINVRGGAEQIPTTEDPVPETPPKPPRQTRRKTAGNRRNKFEQPKTAATHSIIITVNELSVYLLISILLISYGLYI